MQKHCQSNKDVKMGCAFLMPITILELHHHSKESSCSGPIKEINLCIIHVLR